MFWSESWRKNTLYLRFLLTILICYLFAVEGKILGTSAKFLFLCFYKMLRFNTSTLSLLLFYVHPIFSRNAAESFLFLQKTPGIIVNERTVSTSVELVPKVGFTLSNLRLVHTSNANANAGASTSKHSCELPRRKKMENFLFFSLAFALVFAFHTCEPGQRKGKRTV